MIVLFLSFITTINFSPGWEYAGEGGTGNGRREQKSI